MSGSVINRDRLAKVLALMSSPVDGEALAATRTAVKMLADFDFRQRTWSTAFQSLSSQSDLRW